MIALLPLLRFPRWLRTALFGVQGRARRSVSPSVALGRPLRDCPSQAVLGLSWREIPLRPIARPEPPPAPRDCHCWGCGRAGVAFCADGCLPATSNNLVGPWKPGVPLVCVPPTEAEEAADARIAAVLDAERAA